MVIASIFNGYGGGMLASIKANIPITKYYYSEIDKYANIVMDANFPDAIPIGDVTKVDACQVIWSLVVNRYVSKDI